MDDSTKVPKGVADTETITLNIVHQFPEDSRLIFSDTIAAQHTNSEFTITFSQIRQPMVTEAAEFESMKNVRADVVARIVLTPPKMLELVRLLQENWKLYQTRMKALMEKHNVPGTSATTATDSPSSDNESE